MVCLYGIPPSKHHNRPPNLWRKNDGEKRIMVKVLMELRFIQIKKGKALGCIK